MQRCKLLASDSRDRKPFGETAQCEFGNSEICGVVKWGMASTIERVDSGMLEELIKSTDSVTVAILIYARRNASILIKEWVNLWESRCLYVARCKLFLRKRRRVIRRLIKGWQFDSRNMMYTRGRGLVTVQVAWKTYLLLIDERIWLHFYLRQKKLKVSIAMKRRLHKQSHENCMDMVRHRESLNNILELGKKNFFTTEKFYCT